MRLRGSLAANGILVDTISLLMNVVFDTAAMQDRDHVRVTIWIAAAQPNFAQGLADGVYECTEPRKLPLARLALPSSIGGPGGNFVAGRRGGNLSEKGCSRESEVLAPARRAPSEGRGDQFASSWSNAL
jgi:hypothetical protein